MPAAIPVAVGLGTTLLGSALQNGQNKATQANANNQAAGARQYDTQALNQAMQRLQSYMAANPSPASQYKPIQGPTSVYGQQAPVVNSPTTGVPSLMGALGGGQGGSGKPGMTLPIALPPALNGIRSA